MRPQSFKTFILCIFFPIASFSQQIDLQIDLGLTRKNDFLFQNSFIDPLTSNQQFFLSLPCRDKLHFYLLDHSLQVAAALDDTLTEHGAPKHNEMFFDKEYSPTGSISTGTNKVLCAFTKDNESIYFNDIDFNTKAYSLHFSWKTPKKEALMFCFPYMNQFFWLTVSRQSMYSLKLYRYDTAGQLDSLNFTVDGFFPQDMSPKTHYWTDDVSLIHPERVTSLLQSSVRGKIFPRGNKMYVVSDENTSFTSVTAVWLDTFKTEQYNINYSDSSPSSAVYRKDGHNSYIVNDLLLQANVQDDKFTFSISPLKKGNAIRKSFGFGKSDDISFNNSMVLQTGTYLENKGEKELTRSSQFIRKVNNSSLALLGDVYKGSLRVQMGSSQIVSVPGGGGSSYMPGGAFGTPGGMVTMPGHWNSFGGGGYKYSKTVYFYSIFDSNTLEHLPGNEPGTDKIGKLDDFLEKFSRHLLDPVLINSTIITGYYDIDDRKFNLVHF